LNRSLQEMLKHNNTNKNVIRQSLHIMKNRGNLANFQVMSAMKGLEIQNNSLQNSMINKKVLLRHVLMIMTIQAITFDSLVVEGEGEMKGESLMLEQLLQYASAIINSVTNFTKDETDNIKNIIAPTEDIFDDVIFAYTILFYAVGRQYIDNSKYGNTLSRKYTRRFVLIDELKEELFKPYVKLPWFRLQNAIMTQSYKAVLQKKTLGAAVKALDSIKFPTEVTYWRRRMLTMFKNFPINNRNNKIRNSIADRESRIGNFGTPLVRNYTNNRQFPRF
jgi:hypothetical protein